MKRFARTAIAAAAILGAFAASTAVALPPLPKVVEEAFKDDADAKKFLTAFGAVKAKCDLCHVPGKDKQKEKNHALNDFGEALHKSIDFKAYKDAMKAKDNAAQVKLFKEGYTKAAAEKNADGKTFGELIKAGSLPGKNS